LVFIAPKNESHSLFRQINTYRYRRLIAGVLICIARIVPEDVL